MNGIGNGREPDTWAPTWLQPATLLAAFLAVYVACAAVAQAVSAVPPSEEGAPIEAFTSGLLWIIAIYGLLRSSDSIGSGKRIVFWLAFTAALGALAVDEIVGVHERTEPGLNDDWLKVVLWLATPFVLHYIAQIERAPRDARMVMVIGFVFHSAYVLVEVGDGAAFTLPVSIDTLKWAEEYFELLFLACYTFALWILVLRAPRRSSSLDAPHRGDGI